MRGMKTTITSVAMILGFSLALPFVASAGGLKKLQDCQKAASINYIQDLDDRLDDLEGSANFLVSKTTPQYCPAAQDGLKNVKTKSQDVLARVKRAVTPMSYLESNGDKATDSKPCTESLRKAEQGVQDLYQKTASAITQKCNGGWANPGACDYSKGNGCR